MGRKNYLLRIAYDGSDYEGWQRLPSGQPSIQASLELALGRVLEEPLELTGASRTDRGVHAEGQAASFHTRSPKSPETILAGLDRELPPDIVVTSIREVDPRFHARFRALSKLYRYRLHVGPRPDPLLRRYSQHVAGPLELRAMEEAARLFVGERDFRAFSHGKEEETRRSLETLRIEASGSLVELYFEGKSFLYNQVRLMAAALLAVGEGKLGPGAIEAAFASGERGGLPGALGPWGLCLLEVRYRL